MNVPRETNFNRPGAKRTVRPLRLPADLVEAIERGQKTTHRFPVGPLNSLVRPGNFAGLDLESGRRRGYVGGQVELRARCRFESGDVRAVSVTSQIQRGDLYWVAARSGTKHRTLRTSRLTLEVVGVDVVRLQDIDGVSARLEGFADVEQFRVRWDRSRRGADYWRLNPWVWVVRFNTHAGGVLDLFAGEV